MNKTESHKKKQHSRNIMAKQIKFYSDFSTENPMKFSYMS